MSFIWKGDKRAYSSTTVSGPGPLSQVDWRISRLNEIDRKLSPVWGADYEKDETKRGVLASEKHQLLLQVFGRAEAEDTTKHVEQVNLEEIANEEYREQCRRKVDAVYLPSHEGEPTNG
jgi:hypothetical protein